MKIIKLGLLFFLTLFSNLLTSKSVDQKTAETIAYNFLKNNTTSAVFKGELRLNLVHTYSSKEQSTNTRIALHNYIYIFNVNDIGFVAVSGDDVVFPILGYSDEIAFDPSNVNINAQKWFQGYADQIRFAIVNDLEATEEISNEWLDLLAGNNNSIQKRRGSVSPLITTKWNQGKYYNDLCPYDLNNSERTVTGCVATAMAQVIKYWQFPNSGTSFHSYTHNTLGTISSNFANHTYDFSNMPNYVNSTNYDVAQLMFDCGVSVEMNYGISSNGGSGAYVISSASPVTHCTEYALKKYFGFLGSLEGHQRTSYSDAVWISMLKKDLDADQPIIYAGFGNGGGHCFIADGYDNNDYIHFNWGWGGSSDGYFRINALNPGSLGSGGGTGGYNSRQQAIFGIAPPSSGFKFDLSLNTVMTISSSTISYGQSFDVKVNFTNNSNTTFSGDYGAAIFDDNDNFIDFVEIKTGYSLQSGYKYTNDLVFSTNGMLKMLPGKYWVGVFYRPTGGNWDMIKGTFWYSNYKSMTVTNNNPIALYSELTLVGDQYFIQGKGGTVKVNIINNGSTTFKGKYAVSLYNLDGTIAQNINVYTEIDGLSAGYVYSNPLNFTTTEVTVSPGTYLLAVQHISDGSSNWQLTGTGNFLNPILVDVQAPPIQADIYEINDNATLAYSMPLNFSGKSALINTNGSNCHNGSDYDFYKINLANGYNYTLNPRIHDELNAGNNKVYTLDALFSYSVDGGSSWSDVYDDIIPNSIIISGGKSVLFKVAPYFSGQTGTYLLEIPITRESNLITNQTKQGVINIYPNPTEDFININAGKLTINEISIFDIQGREIDKYDLSDKQFKLFLGDFKMGTYLIKISTSNGDYTEKIIKE